MRAIDALALRRAASGGEWLEQLQLFGGASDPFLVRSPKRGAYLVEGPLRRQIKAGMLFVALAQVLPLRNASESELDTWVEGPPVEVLEGRSGAAFVVVGARRLPLRGLPLPHPVTDDEMLAFPEGEELRIGYVSSPDRGPRGPRAARCCGSRARCGAASQCSGSRRGAPGARCSPRPDYDRRAVGVFVVGMHRSGTSAVAAALESFGFGVGAPGELMAPDAANPSGYFELQAIADLNDDLLVHWGGKWDSPPRLPEGWQNDPEMAAFVRRIMHTMKAQLPRGALADQGSASHVDPSRVAPGGARPVRGSAGRARPDGSRVVDRAAQRGPDADRARAVVGVQPRHVARPGRAAGVRVLVRRIGRRPARTARGNRDFARRVGRAPRRGRHRSGRGTRASRAAAQHVAARDSSDSLERPGEIDRLEKYLSEQLGPHDAFGPSPTPAAPWEQALLDERRAAIAERHAVDGQLKASRAELESLRRTLDTTRSEASRRVTELMVELDAARAAVARLEAEVANLRGAAARGRTARAKAEQAQRARADAALARADARWDRLEHLLPMRIFRVLQVVRKQLRTHS